MKNNNEFHIGVDVGGTKIAFGIVDSNNDIIRIKNILTKHEDGVGSVIARIIDGIMEILEEASLSDKEVNSIGIGIPGTVELDSGKVILAPNIRWENVLLGTRLKEAFPRCEIFFDQDTNAAALGEMLLHRPAGINNLFYMVISTGIGSGIIIDKKIHHGALNTAGEIGHIVVERNGRQCTCGNKGCLQMYANGPSIANNMKRKLREGRKSVFCSMVGFGVITTYDIAEAAENGDSLAREVLLESADYIGCAVANIVTVFNPDLVILGGGVSKIGSFFFDRIKETVKNHCYPSTRNLLRIEVSKHWEKAAIIGAASLYKDQSREGSYERKCFQY